MQQVGRKVRAMWEKKGQRMRKTESGGFIMQQSLTWVDDGGVRVNKVRETCHATESKKHQVNTLEPGWPLINICAITITSVCPEKRRSVGA